MGERHYVNVSVDVTVGQIFGDSTPNTRSALGKSVVFTLGLEVYSSNLLEPGGFLLMSNLVC